MKTPAISRRVLGQAAGALVVAFSLRPAAGRAAEVRPKLPGSLNNNRMLDAWLRVDADGTVSVFPGKVELGQGAVTALAQIVAEELDLPVANVHMMPTETGRSPDEGHTSGSFSIENGGTALRLAGAEARALLLARAAAMLGAPVADLTTSGGRVTAPGKGAGLSYGALVDAGSFHREVPANVPTKPPAAYRIVGTSVPRLDIPAKISGGAIYVQDMRLPEMLHGRIARPPSPRATLVDIDLMAVRQMPGVTAAVRNGNFLGVVANREEQAIAARALLLKSAKWKEAGDLPDPETIGHWLRTAPAETSVVNQKTGTVPPAQRRLAASYSRPYLAHASIGPSCAIAQYSDPGRLQVWSHSQGVYPLRQDLAKALDMSVEAITVTHVQGSGCYGHNGADDVALDAALLARAAGNRPVRVQWMRDDEFQNEPYGPVMVTSLDAGLSEDGTILEWNCEVWSNTHSTRPGFPDGVNLQAAWLIDSPKKSPKPRAIPLPNGGGDRNAVPLYVFPVQKVTSHLVLDMPLRVSSLRTLGGFHNVFATESFIDELAALIGNDVIAFRLRHLGDARAQAVIEAAAKAARWQPGAAGDGSHGRGIGFARYKNGATYVAVIADVTVNRKTGEIAVPHLTLAADAGLIVNPDGLTNQLEGGAIQATSWTLHEAVGFDRSHIAARDWASYPILTFPEVPKVAVMLLDHPTEPALGAGEAAQGPTAAAIVNAVAHATGVRFRDLPLTAERVKAAVG